MTLARHTGQYCLYEKVNTVLLFCESDILARNLESSTSAIYSDGASAGAAGARAVLQKRLREKWVVAQRQDGRTARGGAPSKVDASVLLSPGQHYKAFAVSIRGLQSGPSHAGMSTMQPLPIFHSQRGAATARSEPGLIS